MDQVQVIEVRGNGSCGEVSAETDETSRVKMEKLERGGGNDAMGKFQWKRGKKRNGGKEK